MTSASRYLFKPWICFQSSHIVKEGCFFMTESQSLESLGLVPSGRPAFELEYRISGGTIFVIRSPPGWHPAELQIVYCKLLEAGPAQKWLRVTLT